MKLSEAVNATAGMKFIGASKGGGFVAIAENIDFGELDEKIRYIHKIRMASIKYHIKKIEKAGAEDKGKAKKQKEKLKKYRQGLREEKEFAKTFTSIADSEVVEIYKRYKKDGTIIIFEGREHGKLWNISDNFREVTEDETDED